MIEVKLELSPTGAKEPTILIPGNKVQITGPLPQTIIIKDTGQDEVKECLAASIFFETQDTKNATISIAHPYWLPQGINKVVARVRFQGVIARIVLHSKFLREWMGPKQTNYSHPSVFVSEIYNETLTTHSPCQTNLTYPIGEGWNAQFDKERGIQLLQGETLMMEVSLVYVGCGNISIELFPD